MWHNKILGVNLTTRKIEIQPLDDGFVKRYLGGRALGVKLFRQFGMVEPEDAPLIFVSGPLAPYGAPAACRISLVSRSPLTRTIFDSNAGGALSLRLKNCGVDGIIIEGRAKKTSVIKVTPKGASIEEAQGSENATVGEFTAKLSRNVSSAVVGPAAFSGFKFANVMVDRYGAFGRGGLGRLFALKNLKAVVVEAPLKVQKPIHKERYEMAVKAVLRLFTASPAVKALSAFGTPFLVRITNWLSLLPVNNFRAGGCSEAESLCAENIPAISTAKRAGCFGCPIRCKRRSNDDALPEFETIALVGASCGVFDYDAVRLVNRIANEQGVDTISLGGTLAAFFELCGIKPDGKRLVETVKNLFSGLREFEILKEGAHKMCEIEGAPSVSMCVKGLELPGYDPRGATGMALAYATSNRGACHLRAYMVGPEILRKPRPLSRFSFDGKAGYLRVFQDRFSMCDSLGVCKFAFFAATEEEYAELLSAASGVEYSAEDLMRIGSETYDSERRYNEACGFSKSDDRLPERFFKEKASETVDALKKESFDAALSEYYSIRSW